MTGDELRFVKEGLLLVGPVGDSADDLLTRVLEERRCLLYALKLSYDEESCWAHDVAGIAWAAIDFAEAPLYRERAAGVTLHITGESFSGRMTGIDTGNAADRPPPDPEIDKP